ncbi:MAG: hypothetical protein ACRD3Q_08070, partial [Terriglobales bacterium]
MTTQRNKAARAAETREEKRKRLADPALANAGAERRQEQDGNQALQAGLSAARKQECENRKRELTGEIRNLKRMQDRALCGYTEAARAGYIRTYDRLARLAQVIADEFGESVTIPAYD